MLLPKMFPVNADTDTPAINREREPFLAAIAVAPCSDHLLRVAARLAHRFSTRTWIAGTAEVVGHQDRGWTARELRRAIAANDAERLLEVVRWQAGPFRADRASRSADQNLEEIACDLASDVDAGIEFFHLDPARGPYSDTMTTYDRITRIEWMLEQMRPIALPRAQRIRFGFESGSADLEVARATRRCRESLANRRGFGLPDLVTGAAGAVGQQSVSFAPATIDWVGRETVARRQRQDTDAGLPRAPLVLVSTPAAVELQAKVRLSEQVDRDDLASAFRLECCEPQARGIPVPVGMSKGVRAGFYSGRSRVIESLTEELASACASQDTDLDAAIDAALEDCLMPWYELVNSKNMLVPQPRQRKTAAAALPANRPVTSRPADWSSLPTS